MYKKIILLFICLIIVGIGTMSAQVRFSATANVYSNDNNQKIGRQYIAANITNNGVGTMTLGNLTWTQSLPTPNETMYIE